MKDNCGKKYKDENIELDKFCNLFTQNKVSKSKEFFKTLSKESQCFFLHWGWEILSNKNKYSEEAYRNSFLLFKLFRSPEMKALPVYKKYINPDVEKMFKEANQKKTKVFDNKLQKKTIDLSDPLVIYYTTLYKEKGKSINAIKWLTEHGIFSGNERKKLEEKYVKINK